MKKFFVGLLIFVIVGAAGIYLFRAPLMEVVMENMTADMFVAEDTDRYDPGVAVGQPLPQILASHHGTHVTNLASFAGPRGIVLYAIRSVDW